MGAERFSTLSTESERPPEISRGPAPTRNFQSSIKQASRELLAGVLQVIVPLDRWTEKEQTQAEVQTFILDHVYQTLPEPPYTPDDKQQVAKLVYRHIWQQSVAG